MVESNKHSGLVDAMELGVGGELVAVRANDGKDLVQAVEAGHRVQLVLHHLVLGVLLVFTVVIFDTFLSSVPGSPMQCSSRTMVSSSREVDVQDEVCIL